MSPISPYSILGFVFSLIENVQSKREASLVNVTAPTALQATPIARHEAKLISIPSRGSSDGNKRTINPSPLSRPLAMSPEKNSPIDSLATQHLTPPSSSSSNPGTPLQTDPPESPAAQHLAALNKKDAKREGKPSRLRRAFSFGSAAELRKASAENNMNNNLSIERAKLRKDRYHNEQEALEAQQAAIAQKENGERHEERLEVVGWAVPTEVGGRGSGGRFARSRTHGRTGINGDGGSRAGES